MKDHQLAVYGDEGIHKKVGPEYWSAELKKMIDAFDKNNYAEGIRDCVEDIGQALQHHFPFNNDTDKNELPDDIVFGRWSEIHETISNDLLCSLYYPVYRGTDTCAS